MWFGDEEFKAERVECCKKKKMAEGEVWEAEFIKHTIRPQPGQTSNLFHPFLVSPTYIC